MNNIIIEKVIFSGPKKVAEISLLIGVNVICGASDTGKSYFAETIDYMFGGSELKPIPETDGYDKITIIVKIKNEKYVICRAIVGGDFSLSKINTQGKVDSTLILSSKHEHNKTDNLSGFLLNIIGLLGKRILFSKTNYTTRSLSFRNIARLSIIQDEEIQTKGSPFWDGQYTQKTLELATIKLLLSGIDDSSIQSVTPEEQEPIEQINFLEETINEMKDEFKEFDKEISLRDQLNKLNTTIEKANIHLDEIEKEYNDLITRKNKYQNERNIIQNRVNDINEHLARFKLLKENYQIDNDRLLAIKESGSMFLHLTEAPCPLCGALPETKHNSSECEGNSVNIISAAESEIVKIKELSIELEKTIKDLSSEKINIEIENAKFITEIDSINKELHSRYSIDLKEHKDYYSELLNKKNDIINVLNKYDILNNFIAKRDSFLSNGKESNSQKPTAIKVGVSDSTMDLFSKRLAIILKEWNFPGDCRVYYDREKCDFVIDGKHRGSRGRGLRAITHAAITIGLLEFCQENSLPHPGIVILDSPLLAYFKPEGDDDLSLQGTNLKEKFYEYLLMHHKESQIVIIENQHPPIDSQVGINMIVFTGNQKSGRYGLL